MKLWTLTWTLLLMKQTCYIILLTLNFTFNFTLKWPAICVNSIFNPINFHGRLVSQHSTSTQSHNYFNSLNQVNNVNRFKAKAVFLCSTRMSRVNSRPIQNEHQSSMLVAMQITILMPTTQWTLMMMRERVNVDGLKNSLNHQNLKIFKLRCSISAICCEWIRIMQHTLCGFSSLSFSYSQLFMDVFSLRDGMKSLNVEIKALSTRLSSNFWTSRNSLRQILQSRWTQQMNVSPRGRILTSFSVQIWFNFRFSVCAQSSTRSCYCVSISNVSMKFIYFTSRMPSSYRSSSST